MKSPYFCAYHAQRMKNHESEALRYWIDMMRRGTQAYVECRIDAANIYLGSALDIALIRKTCEKNEFFNDMHFCKPAEFLIKLMLIENRFNEAIVILSRLSSASQTQTNINERELTHFLEKHYENIEIAEKEYMTRRAWGSNDTNEKTIKPGNYH